ncbi:MAG TPA: cytochrome c oxidase assembly factor Coa1 family protein [Chthoniobacterales bacterium]|nr:cytochrome c oxidase assembly factor Coa1 family protein [Chthoniobacterales bacterium]
MDSTPPPPSPPPQPFTPAPQPSPQPAPSWWNRNWKWFVPTGCCLGSILAILLAIVVFGAGIFGIISGVGKILKSSEPYQTALARAKSNEKVVTALGTPIEEGFPMGSVNTNNDSGDADLSIPVTGPKGKGTIYVVGTRSGGTWTYSKMSVKITGTDEEIDLSP